MYRVCLSRHIYMLHVNKVQPIRVNTILQYNAPHRIAFVIISLPPTPSCNKRHHTYGYVTCSKVIVARGSWTSSDVTITVRLARSQGHTEYTPEERHIHVKNAVIIVCATLRSTRSVILFHVIILERTIFRSVLIQTGGLRSIDFDVKGNVRNTRKMHRPCRWICSAHLSQAHDRSISCAFAGLSLTLILLMWRIWWAPNNASKWQMEFNSEFKGLKPERKWTLGPTHQDAK
jgi:hypothetical protein